MKMCVSLQGLFVLFSNEEAVRGSIRLEEDHLEEALAVDPEGKRRRGIVAEAEGMKKSAAHILEGGSQKTSTHWRKQK
jgi:hypothetical protein